MTQGRSAISQKNEDLKQLLVYRGLESADIIEVQDFKPLEWQKEEHFPCYA
jgi:hypothetical protein